MLDATELLRASTTDADAVQQYLQTIDKEELDRLLDQFADGESRKKASGGSSGDNGDGAGRGVDAGDWLALVHLMLRTEASRQRTATRVIQLLWRGTASELEATQWLTEVSLGYVAALDSEQVDVTATRLEKKKTSAPPSAESCLTRELRTILEIVYEFLSDVIAQPRAGKVLPPLLALIPLLLNVLVDVTTSRQPQDITVTALVHDHVVRLLELPWDCKTTPHLLELLREHSELVSLRGWEQLLQSVTRLLSVPRGLPTDCMNPLFRECMYVASASRHPSWVNLGRSIFRRLPTHLRQEAEFHLQMCLHQCPVVMELICDSMQLSIAMQKQHGEEGSDVIPYEWRDSVLLAHTIRASKPILHHHQASTARSELKDSLFMQAQALVYAILLQELKHESDPITAQTDKTIHAATAVVSSSTASDATHIRSFQQRIDRILAFGGRAVHAREWKALVLIDLARFWVEQHRTDNSSGDAGDLANRVLHAVFVLTPEVRGEMLRHFLETSKVPGSLEYALTQLSLVFRDHTSLIIPHVIAVEDWLSSLTHSHMNIATACFRVVCPLVQAHKAFYNFLMMFLRKLLSSPHQTHQRLALDVWCSWLEEQLGLDAQQEEELVLAIKNGIHACPRELQMWCFHRLARVFSGRRLRQPYQHARNEKPTNGFSLRRESWITLHEFLERTLDDFIVPHDAGRLKTHTMDEFDEFATDNCGDEDEYADESDQEWNSERNNETDRSVGETQVVGGHLHSRRSFIRFHMSTLDSFYAQNRALSAALRLGELFENVFQCLFYLEQRVSLVDDNSTKDVDSIRTAVRSDPFARTNRRCMTRDMMRWLTAFVLNADALFSWVSIGDQDSDADASQSLFDFFKPGNGRVVWNLAARISIASALCNVVLTARLRRPSVFSSSSSSSSSSMWALWEVQLCLRRLWQRVAGMLPATMLANTRDKQQAAALTRSTVTTLRPFLAFLLHGMAHSIADSSSSSAPIAHGMSLDGALFLLDTCTTWFTHTSSLETSEECSEGEGHENGQNKQRENITQGGATMSSSTSPVSVVLAQVSALVALYDCVLTHAEWPAAFGLPSPSAGSANEPMIPSPSARAVFTVYADSLAARFPRAIRHLVDPTQLLPSTPSTPDETSAVSSSTASSNGSSATSSSLAVVLDSSAGAELLNRICAALAKALEWLAKRDALPRVVHAFSALSTPTSATQTEESAPGLRSSAQLRDALECVALRLLGDTRRAMAVSTLSRFRMSSASLAKQLLTLSESLDDDEQDEDVGTENIEHGGKRMLSHMAYSILCENVVPHVPLVRVLLGIALSPRLIRDQDVFVTSDEVFARCDAVLVACGFRSNKRRSTPTKQRKGSSQRTAESDSDTDNEVRVGRKRLRKGGGASRSPSRVKCKGRYDYEDDEDDGNERGGPSAPLLSSAASQAAGIQAVLLFLERVYVTMLQDVVQEQRQSKLNAHDASFVNQLTRERRTVRYCRANKILAGTVWVTRDMTWVTMRILSRLLSILDTCVRIGKTSSALAVRAAGTLQPTSVEELGDGTDADKRDDELVCQGPPTGKRKSTGLLDAFESSVSVALVGRAWLSMIRDGSQGPVVSTSKLSAVILKLDVFLLDVPMTVEALMKTDGLNSEEKARVRSFVSIVEMELLATGGPKNRSTTEVANTPTKKQKRQQKVNRHLVGVVPLVKRRRTRLRSRHPFIDSCLGEEDGGDAYADLEDFIV